MGSARDAFAAILRNMPPFRGKGQIGHYADRCFGVPSGSMAVRQTRMRDGSLLALDSRNSAEKWAYWTGEFDSRLIRRIAAACGDQGSIIDVGANIGLWTIPLARQVAKSGGKVYAFEPVPSNFAVLSNQIAANELQTTVTAFRIALGDEEGTAFLSLIEANHETETGNARVVPSADLARGSEAPLTRLDTWAQQQKLVSCRFIKLDVEGFEFHVLRGAQAVIREHRPLIFGEFSAHWLSEVGHSIQNVGELLTSLNYRPYVRTRKDDFVPCDNLKSGVEDVLFAPRETSLEVLSKCGVVQ